MRRWFLSYHSPDQEMAERLKAALERKDTGAHVFFAPSSLRAGGFWSKALAEEIAQADAFILLVGERGVGNWQVLEYDEALDKRAKFPDFPVILVLLEGQTAPGLPFLRRLHWIITPDPSSEKDLARLFDAASGSSTRPGELWRHTSPYRGLAAMEEQDGDYFFGRSQETVDALSALAVATDRLPVLLGNSGVGKSSLAQAGVLAGLKRQAWPERIDTAPDWPHAFRESRRWCFLKFKPGTEPLKALVESFLDTWQLGATDPERVKEQNGWIELLRDGNAMLRDLLDATERRYNELDRTKPPAFLLYVDQGEELYVRAEEHQRHRFSELIAQGIADPRLHMLMSMRSDFLGELQQDEPLFKVHRKIDVPPLREAELREVVSQPAELLSARFDTDGLVDIITRRAAEDSVKDVGALPLLSYSLDDMWTQMMKRGDGVLRLPAQSFELGGVLVDRADAFLAAHPQSQEQLRRIFTLKLATVHEGEEPTRRRAARSEFTDEEWRLVSGLADHPNRLLVTATPEEGETYAEVAHETIFRRWERLREWTAQEREFLIWKSSLEGDRGAWGTAPADAKTDALLMGLKLAQAQSWLAKRAGDLSSGERRFIDDSIRRDAQERTQRQRLHQRTWQMGALAGVLALGIGAGLAWSNRVYLKARTAMVAEMIWSKALTAEAEHALKPGDRFFECADCPEMVVVPSGEFLMGSLEGYSNESPRHKVAIGRPFAVSRFEITSDEWDACVLLGGCPRPALGRGRRPATNVSWEDAQQYAAWLAQRTGKPYRLLSEAEWEYAARAGSDKAYSWGDEIGKGNANCNSCGSQWDYKLTAPVGSFEANSFGLFDMHGNVSELVEDCYHDNYNGAPADGSAWSESNCSGRLARGGSWVNDPRDIRAAVRAVADTAGRYGDTGFRIGRTLP
jgi:formylglycine-generating enzyme required for sulfatase activity